MGYLGYQKYIKYEPNYKTISIELPESQKEVLLTYDANKWEGNPYIFNQLFKQNIYDSRGLLLSSRRLKINEGGEEREFQISFDYEFDAKSYDLCMDGNTGEACEPNRPSELNSTVNTNVVVKVDGKKLLVPTFNTEERFKKSRFNDAIYQFFGDKVTDWLTIGTRNPDKQDFNERFTIIFDKVDDFKTWKKEIEPELIQIMKSLKIKKIPNTETEQKTTE